MKTRAPTTREAGWAPNPLAEVLQALGEIRRHMQPTLLARVDELSKRIAGTVYAKHENLAPSRAFKVRGSLYRISRLSPHEQAAGVVVASTGNLGIGTAYAGRAFNTPVTVVVPVDTPVAQVERARSLGAEVRLVGDDIAGSEGAARALAIAEGSTFIDDGNDRILMVGAATVAFEILLERPSVEVLIVPVGGGNLIAGIALCAKAIKPEIVIVGVQAQGAPAVYESWKAGHVVRCTPHTFAAGLAGDHPGQLALDAIISGVDDFVLVSDRDLRHATVTAIEHAGQALDGAAAAGIAALERYGDRWQGNDVALVFTAGNADRLELSESLRISGPQG